jgi:acetyl-CoA C-acetyltransferase
MGERVAIIGIGQTRHRSRRPDVNCYEMINEAVRLALEDAGIGIKDIDAVITGNMDLFEGHYLSGPYVSDYCAAFMKPGMKMNTGGTTGGTVVHSAVHHVSSGLFRTALAIGWQKQDAAPSISALLTAREPLYDRGISAGAVNIFATMGLKYMEETGCPEEIAAISRVNAGYHASKNPNAHVRQEVTVEEVMKSRIIVWPVRLLHMSPTSCGACVLVLANESFARRMEKKKVVWVMDHCVVHRETFTMRGGMVEAKPEPYAIQVGAEMIYKRNGITNPAKEIDCWELYIPSSWAEMPFMEWCHICEKGQAWRLVEKGETRLDGSVPQNPSGGVVCTNPIGASGVIRVAEAALQIRGDAGEHQVTRKDVKKAMASSWGSAHWWNMTLLSKTI